MDKQTCPSCQSTKTAKNGNGRFRCGDCGRQWGVHRQRHSNGITGTCSRCRATGEQFYRAGTRLGQQTVRCLACGCRQMLADITTPHQASLDGDLFVVTCAQNATEPHGGFLTSLRRYCKERGARLVIVPVRYKNPTIKGDTEEDDWWHPSVAKHLIASRVSLAPGLQLLADIKIQPTAVSPLSGMDTITGTACGIFGHPKVAMASIPTRGHELPKLIWTTGAVTIPNYSESKAGAKGAHHHVLGALVVERDGDVFHVRNINAEPSGAFIDLDRRYTPKESAPAAPAAALVMGDIHAERADEAVIEATLGHGGIVDTLRPRRLVLHDVLDFGSASHHNGIFERVLRRVTGRDDVAAELALTCAFIDECHRPGSETVIVSSNHHYHLEQWLERSDYRADPANAHTYAAVLAEMLAAIHRDKAIPDPFALVAGRMLQHPATFIPADCTYEVCGIELAYHGDIGPNGSRGSAKALERIGAKTVIGHSHSPCIVGGCYQTGTSSRLQMGYNVGPSSWLHSHVLIYANGKRTHINVVRGQWRKGDV